MNPERQSEPRQSSANNHLREALDAIESLSANVQKVKCELSSYADLMAMRMAAISAASYQNTEATRKERIDRWNDYWTPAYGDVCAAVDREIAIKRNAAWTCALHAYPYGFSEDGPHDPVCPWCERLEVEQLQEKLAAAHEKLAEIGRERSEWKREAIELRKEVAAFKAELVEIGAQRKGKE